MSPRDLPIYELESDLVRTLRAGGRLIVQAPTGSGKSTQIPQMLLQHGLAGEKGEIVVLQPRRLAARMLAKRVAEQEQCSRREAELHIVAGNVQVDGKVVQVPETRVRPDQVVILRKDAKPEAIPPVTILMPGRCQKGHAPEGARFLKSGLGPVNRLVKRVPLIHP